MTSLEILHSDPSILLINKPSGLLSVPDGYEPDLPHLKSLLEPDHGKLWMIHRLDKGSSGVMVLARNAEAHRFLSESFREREVLKHYIALVSPSPPWKTQECTAPLLTNAGRRHLTKVDPIKGKPAQSNFEKLEENGKLALLQCRIHTGYRHQIRAHLYHLGIGILGDELYRPKANLVDPDSVPRLMLHAEQLAFSHPETKLKVSFSCKPPALFYDLLNQANPTDWDAGV